MVVAGRAIAPRELRQVRKEATVNGPLNVLINLAAATMKKIPRVISWVFHFLTWSLSQRHNLSPPVLGRCSGLCKPAQS